MQPLQQAQLRPCRISTGESALVCYVASPPLDVEAIQWLSWEHFNSPSALSPVGSPDVVTSLLAYSCSNLSRALVGVHYCYSLPVLMAC